MSARSPGGVVVRELRWSDFDPLREQYLLLYEERESNPDIGITLFGEPPSYADEVAWFSGFYRRVLDGTAIARVAELDGAVAGDCVVTRHGPGPPGFEQSHSGVLGILVRREFRGRGVGDALMRETLAACHGKFAFVRLSVFATNPRARALYERHGFVVDGRVRGAIRRAGRYIDEDLMSLDLRSVTANR
jgi:RimJ/RimL family protein N-acetyltransferase